MKWNKSLFLIIAICLSQFVYGQESSKKSDKLITITGKVLDNNKKPVEGAVLYVDNIKTSNVTKSNGSYKIKVSSSAVNLEVRSEEYGSVQIQINGQTSIDFVLEGTNEAFLNQVDKAKEAASKDSVVISSSPKGKKINSYNNIYQMIRGEVSGVIVSGRSIQIQQGHSFFGSGTPLFVVNGMIVQSIDNINPLEVKSIHVLKGSAASIYGVNGSNGVLSITLKNGTESEMK